MSELRRDFDALEWINQQVAGGSKLDYDQLRPVLCFPLIWNLFETRACRCEATPTSICEAVVSAMECGQLSGAKYMEHVDFFREQYLADGDIEGLFARLYMDRPCSQTVVRGVLLKERHDPTNVVSALLLIAHRIRNNLFHGNKAVETLPIQTEVFRVLNRLLATFLEDIQAGVDASGGAVDMTPDESL